jgi:pectin methylesterase-like acyl-CoA thioesterase
MPHPSPRLPSRTLLTVTAAGALLAAAATAIPLMTRASADATLTVGPDSRYRNVQAAIDAVPSGNSRPVTISIAAGTYQGPIVVPSDKPYITLRGADGSSRSVVLTGNRSQSQHGAAGAATLRVSAHDVTVADLTIANTHGVGTQAQALYAGEDRQVYRNVRVLGHQDTLLTWSGKDGKVIRQYYTACYVEGDLDFIYGDATAVFDGCEIRSLSRGSRSDNGYITAASTWASNPRGFLFTGSWFTGDVAAGTVSLGRPWHAGGKADANGSVVVRNSYLGPHINADQPWRDMSGFSWRTARFAEHRNHGPSALLWATSSADRPQLTAAQAATATTRAWLAGSDGWDPTGSGSTPASSDPASSTPASSTPASSDPASGDPASGDPASSTPASSDLPARAPVSGTPASAPTASSSATGLTSGDLWIAPNGDDAAAGTKAAPYASLAKAVAVVRPGQSIVLRGGIYQPTEKVKITTSGTPSARITLSNYAGETPVLDGGRLPSDHWLLDQRASYWTVQGLEIRNAPSHPYMCTSCRGVTVQRISSHDNQNSGMSWRGDGTVDNQILDSDFYRNHDDVTKGQNADGLAIKFGSGSGNVVRGNRFFHNADDGIDLWMFSSAVTVTGNWAWGNGVDRWSIPGWEGNGNGFKLGGNNVAGAHTVSDNAAWDNTATGFTNNNNPGALTVRHNTAFHNAKYGFSFTKGSATLADNLSLSNTTEASTDSTVTLSGNSWTADGWTTSRLRDTDPSTAQGLRRGDGSLPATSFLVPDDSTIGAAMPG